MTELENIIQLKTGNKEAFTAIYKLYWAKVYNFTCLYISSSHRAEDVVQEVFIKLWETRSLINEELNFKGFLFIITRNIIFNQFRKNVNENAFKINVIKAMDNSYSIDDELDASFLRNYIDQLIGGLPLRQREVFGLSREQNLSYKEIALRLGISEKTVERHINEALKFLKKKMESDHTLVCAVLLLSSISAASKCSDAFNAYW